ncbi:NAD(P)/FAD-dependent oxidoreductase [Thermocatellispora tengchongensis]
MVSGMFEQRDREALRAKYREERDKRIRPDGSDQYIAPTGRFAHWKDDPYTPWVEREPITEHVTLAMVGGGFAGLCVGARLRDAGIDDFRIIESGGDFGGVWYWNRYPGAMCDTAAMIYLPLLEETGYMPSMKYAFGPEIFEHARRIGRHYSLYDKAVFSTQVTSLTWDDDGKHWVVATDRGDRITAKYVAAGTGPLDRPKLPGIPGLETFAGHSFHTSRWDYGYTGGTPEGAPMTKLAGKRVGIIGTGASGVQCVPPLGRDAQELFVFQRTPSTVDERNNRPIDPEWFKTLGPGWQKEWLVNFVTLQTGGFTDVDYVDDGHTDLGKRIRDRWVEINGGRVPEEFDPAAFAKAYQDVDDEKTEEIRRRVDAIVTDPETAARLKAWYGLLCKRPCFHDEYLQTFNRPNVHLVDTDGKGVERIDEAGVWAAGVHYDLDCIIYASGFEFGRDYTSSGALEIIGRDGLALAKKWADGMETFQGMYTRGFPNLFIVGFRQGLGFPINVTSNYTEASLTLAAVVTHAEQVGAGEVETSEDAERAWVEAIESAPVGFIGGAECTPGFYNNEGRPESRAHRLSMTPHPMGPAGFLSYIDEWRTSGRFEGLEFRP